MRGASFFSAIITEICPAMFIEGIYPDYENAKVRYFIFDDTEISKENRNRVSQSEQKIVQDYLNSFRSTGVNSPQMYTPNSFKQWKTSQFDD